MQLTLQDNKIHHQQRKQIQGGCECLLEQGVVSEWKNQSGLVRPTAQFL